MGTVFYANGYVHVLGHVPELDGFNLLGYGYTRTDLQLMRLGLRVCFAKPLAGLSEVSSAKRMMEDRFATGRKFNLARSYRLAKLIRSGRYRGIRMRQGLPRNGQRTHSNAKTGRRFRYRYRVF